MRENVIATIVRKTIDLQRGGFCLVVRSSAFAVDKAIVVSQQEYYQFQPGMLVAVVRAGWGPIRRWGLRR